jgi:CBS domain containing-hemolysin-like protein
MVLLIVYVLVALGFSFLCSIAEAVMLSVTTPHLALMEREGKRSAALMRSLKSDINRPLAAILTLNTIAHTVGAAGAGAQAAVVFGNAYVGIASAVLTLLILILSEIIPKTLGALYWRRLVPATAYAVRLLIWVLYPFVLLAEALTRGLSHSTEMTGFSREELAAMAEQGAKEGGLAKHETNILRNLFRFEDITVEQVMTPRTVVVAAPCRMTVDDFVERYEKARFTRIPIYSTSPDVFEGFVLRGDVLLAHARGELAKPLNDYRRPLMALPNKASLRQAFESLVGQRTHIALVVDEYGMVKGIVTLEDVLETLLGLEIVDESDKTVDMQALARELWRRRAHEMGLEVLE